MQIVPILFSLSEVNGGGALERTLRMARGQSTPSLKKIANAATGNTS